MILLVAAIILFSVSILVSREFLLIQEWFLWACMLVGSFMRGEAESRKLEVLKISASKRFSLFVRIFPEAMWKAFIQRVENEIYAKEYTLVNYNRLIHGIAQYGDDYTNVMKLIEDMREKDKA